MPPSNDYPVLRILLKVLIWIVLIIVIGIGLIYAACGGLLK